MTRTHLPSEGVLAAGPLVQVEALSKSYGATRALSDVSFAVASGEIVGLIGQNGAGKSTLVKILAGLVQPTSGSVRIGGQVDHPRSARDALRRGIVLIPQELAYVQQLSVAENIVLGHWVARGSVVTQARMRTRAARFAAQVGLETPLDAPMSSLSLAERQLVEIAKALSRDAKALLLDEPTAALSDHEAGRLFAVLEGLREHSVATIYISHRLDEVLACTDRVIVLRDGCVVTSGPTSRFSRSQLIESMVGHGTRLEPSDRPLHATSTTGPPVLSLRGVSHEGPGLRGITFDVQPNQIVGLFGLSGSGHETVALSLGGRFPHTRGELYINGVLHPPLKSTRQARRAGILFVPAERKRALVLGHSLRRNFALPQLSRFARWGVVRSRAEERLLKDAGTRLGVVYRDTAQAAQELSGGNQQKLLLASRIYADPTLLLVQEPSRGVDVAAREEIHQLLRELAHQGRTILFATTDVEEAVGLSDRLFVIRAGRVSATLDGDAQTQANALDAAGRSEMAA